MVESKIICGDCMEVMRKQIPDNFVDIIITSPPYNFGVEYDRYNDKVSFEDYFNWLISVWKECYRVLKNSGRICVIVKPLFTDYLRTNHIVATQLEELGLLFKAEILWQVGGFTGPFTAWGSWKSPSMPYLRYGWEFIEVFCKGSRKKEGCKEDIDISGEEFREYIYGEWRINYDIGSSRKFNHPAVCPEEIVYRLLKLFSYKGDLVLDPFNGVGTTTAVADKLQRRYIGIDISKRYCETAEKRIEIKRGIFKDLILQ